MNHERLRDELASLLDKISQSPAEKRYVYHHELDRLLLQLRVSGAEVGPEVRRLNEQLRAEVVEAQFDNLPV